jgi:hypothetical protein
MNQTAPGEQNELEGSSKKHEIFAAFPYPTCGFSAVTSIGQFLRGSLMPFLLGSIPIAQRLQNDRHASVRISIGVKTLCSMRGYQQFRYFFLGHMHALFLIAQFRVARFLPSENLINAQAHKQQLRFQTSAQWRNLDEGRTCAERKRSGPLAVGFPVLLELSKAGKPLRGPEEGSTRLATFCQLAGIRQF